MASAIAPALFVEAPLTVEPTTPDSILHIPTANSSFLPSRKRVRLEDSQPADESEYASRFLASESSIFFRALGRAPRSILWRVLNDRKCLELQSVDLVQDQQATHESLLTFRLHFSAPIRVNGIAFADSQSHDALEAFVLTTSNELFTFSLRRDLLLRATVPSPSDFDPAACFKFYSLSSFKHPYRLWAVSDLALLIALHDGGLLRLDRKSGDSGASWREVSLHDGGWSTSLRGLIPWKGNQSVRWGNVELSPSTAVALQSSPGRDYIFTISLDHTLKSWNATSGKVGFVLDILGQERDEGRAQQPYLINPDQGSMLRVVDVAQRPDGDAYYCVLYSPKDHQFKFWGVRDADSQEFGVRDICPDSKLIPPLDELMNTNIWQLADFDIKPGQGWKNTQVWVRARSGTTSRTFTLTFDLLGSQDELEYAWKHQWSSVAEGSLSIDRLGASSEFAKLPEQVSTKAPNTTVSNDWLDFLLFPGRFRREMLETALQMFQRGIDSSRVSRSNDARNSFPDRLQQAIAAKVGITRTVDVSPDVSRYVSDLAAQWRVFYGLVKHLHQRRTEPLSIALDHDLGLCWSVQAELVAPIRPCSETEVYLLNEDLLVEQDDDWILNSFPLADRFPDDALLSAARLAGAARTFRASLSSDFNSSFERLANTFALRDAEADFRPRARKGAVSPLQQLYEQCDFSSEVGDDEFTRLTEAVQDLGGLGQLENKLFEALIEKLATSPHGQEKDQALTKYGDKVTIRGAQDTLLEGRQILLDILSLVVFMSQDLEADELAKGFRAVDLYSTIATTLREFQVLLWLSSHERAEHKHVRRTSTSGSMGASPSASVESPTTILQSIFIGDWSTMTFPTQSFPDLITYWGRAWTFGADLDGQYQAITAFIMGNLIKHGDHRLAYEFKRYLAHNSWTTYLIGRVQLAEGDYVLAAASFRQSAGDLAEPSTKKVQLIEEIDTSKLLSPVQRRYFNSGRPALYLHISSLFEAAKLPSYAADFASLALVSLEEGGDDGLDSSLMDIDDRKRTLQDSPAAMQVDLAMEEIQLLKRSDLREEILGRLFSNSLQTQRFHAAFEALIRFTNPAIKHASLTQLLTTLLTSAPQDLLELPFPTELVGEVDAALHGLARKQLSSSAPPGAGAPQYYQLLYAFRVGKENYRGAAECLHERLQWLRSLSPDAYDSVRIAARGGRADDDSDDDEGFVDDEEYDDVGAAGLQRELLDVYLLLINTLACCGADEAWILAGPPAPLAPAGHGRTDSAGVPRVIGSPAAGGKSGAGVGRFGEIGAGRRKVVTLDDVRREYQAELDRRSEIAQGRFALVAAGDGMDVDFS